MDSEHVLVTGATGQLGGPVLDALIGTGATVTALVRAASNGDARDRLARYSGRVTALRCDLAEEDLGLVGDTYARLCDEVTVILHGAADTRFDLPLEEARRRNVEPTARMVGFARDAAAHFVHLSTAFVVGRQSGPIPEARLSPEPGYVNSYDWSKHEAEEAVLSAGILSTVVRPSLLMVPGSDNAASLVAGLAAAGRLPICPGYPDDTVDLMTVEEAARATVDVLRHPPGGVVNVASGLRAPTLESIISAGGGKTDYLGYDEAVFAARVEESDRRLYRRLETVLGYLRHPRILLTGRAELCVGRALGVGDPIAALRERVAVGVG